MKSPFSQIADIDRQIEELQEKRAALEERRTQLKALSPIRQFANGLHGLLCADNHTDGCGWDYEEDDEAAWTRECGPRQRWEERAKKVLGMIEQIYEVNFFHRHFKEPVR